MPSLRHLLLSGYIAAPEDPAEEDEFFAGLVDLGIGGIEHALPVEGTRSLEPGWVARNLRPEWDVVVSLVPTMMPRLGVAPTYGLGSLTQDQRARALADVARARDLAVTLAQADGRRRVSAIEVHSAPDRAAARSRRSPARSTRSSAGTWPAPSSWSSTATPTCPDSPRRRGSGRSRTSSPSCARRACPPTCSACASTGAGP